MKPILKTISIIVILLLTASVFGIGYLSLFETYSSDFFLSVCIQFFMIAGIIFQLRLFSVSWRQAWISIGWGTALSIIVLLGSLADICPEVGNCAQEIKIQFPVIFLIALVIVTIFRHEEKVVQQFNETISLGQAIAVLYLFLSSSQPNGIGVVFTLCAFAFIAFHALTHTPLKKSHRFLLSMSSTMAVFIFSTLYLLDFYEYIEHLQLSVLSDWFLFMLRSFLLGTSSAFLFHNFLMLFGFFPRKSEVIFWGEYLERIRELYKQHIDRYSKIQGDPHVAVVVLVLFTVSFTLNYHFDFLPPLTLVWLLFFFYPWIIRLIHRYWPTLFL